VIGYGLQHVLDETYQPHSALGWDVKGLICAERMIGEDMDYRMFLLEVPGV